MKVKHWTYENVEKNGKVPSGGAVNTEPGIDVTRHGEGCNCGTCQDADCYIRVNLGRDEQGTVRGMTMYFDSDKELNKYLGKNNFFTIFEPNLS